MSLCIKEEKRNFGLNMDTLSLLTIQPGEKCCSGSTAQHYAKHQATPPSSSVRKPHTHHTFAPPAYLGVLCHPNPSESVCVLV